MDNSLTKTRIEILLLFALYLVLLPRVYMDYDMGFWRQWALYIHEHGLANAYDAASPINYFPVFVYGLWVFDLLQGTSANIIHNINDIKVLFLCFDFLPLVVLCCFRQKLLSFKIPHFFLLLNAAYVFNSLVWGQIDAIYTSLAFIAIVTAVCSPVAGILLYLVALNTKQQAIEFLPVVLAVLFYSARNFSTVMKGIGFALLLQALIVLPFINTGGPAKLAYFASHAVGLYHNLSISAFNIWYLVARGNPYFINDTDTYFLFSYRTIGIGLFAIALVLIIMPLLKKMAGLKKMNLPLDKNAYEILFLGTGLLCLSFFYFNTQMHERYAHPIIIFFFFHAVISNNYKLYILVSIPYFLSLDKAFSFPDGYLPIVHYKFIYASRVIAIWYTVTIMYGGCLYYKVAWKRKTPGEFA